MHIVFPQMFCSFFGDSYQIMVFLKKMFAPYDSLLTPNLFDFMFVSLLNISDKSEVVFLMLSEFCQEYVSQFLNYDQIAQTDMKK